jgi:hypothetical protein
MLVIGMKKGHNLIMKKAKKASKVKTVLSIDDNLLEELINIAQDLDIPQRQIVSLAREEYIQRYRNKRLLAQINEAYSDEPDFEDTGTLEIIRFQQRKFGENEEWY